MKASVIVFPGSNCDTDCHYALGDIMGMSVDFVWHKERNLPKVDLVVLPGGFSYGDYLRTGAIAQFSPIMDAVKKHAASGRYIIGICNGFQILLETGILPGGMLRNESLTFVCKHIWIKTENSDSIFTKKIKKGETLSIPVAHGEGNYYCDNDTFKSLKDNSQIAFRYSSEEGDTDSSFNPNGSRDNIAGIMNKEKTILGMMPHPERASEKILGSWDGKKIWESLLS